MRIIYIAPKENVIMTWNKVIKDFGHYLQIERSLSENSVVAYLHDILKFSEFLTLQYPGIHPKGVTAKHLREFIEYLNNENLTPFSQARILSGVKAFFKYLIFEEVIEQDPSALIGGPQLGRKLPDTLNFPEIQKLLDAVDLSTPEGTRNRAILETLYSSGLRVSELVDLRMTNIYFDLGFLKVIGKGNKERLVPIGKPALHYIQVYLDH
ncbi:MAG: site-specific integrase, partial [Bacteroidota bacterium]|nr:site-specific integrase [Bacteroidota bacterium]